MLVKICGITDEADALAAVRAGADWIGLNLVGGPRRVGLPRATAILSALGESADARPADSSAASAVVLVRIESSLPDQTLAELRAAGAGRVQLYGEIKPGIVAALRSDGWSVVTVHHMTDADSLRGVAEFLSACPKGAEPDFVLLDAMAPGKLGGTGLAVDWEMLAREREAGRFDGWPPIILAGGLNPENVARAVEFVRPVGVDVSSGVESAPGKKDAARMREFVAAAKGAA